MPHESEFVRLYRCGLCGRTPASPAGPYEQRSSTLHSKRTVDALPAPDPAPRAGVRRAGFRRRPSCQLQRHAVRAPQAAACLVPTGQSHSRVGPPKFTVVLSDNSYHRGSHDEDTMTRVANMWGARWTRACRQARTQDCAAVAARFRRHQDRRRRPSANSPLRQGWRMKYVSATQTARVKAAVGFSVVVDYVVTTGDGNRFLPHVGGSAYRIK